MAMALRPRARASAITSRYGSQALALGERPGGAGSRGSVDTCAAVAGFGVPGSVDTSVVVAGFGGHALADHPVPGHPGGFQIAAGRLSTDIGGLFDAPQRPTQSPQRQYLLFLVVAQDVAHPQRWTNVPPVVVNVSVRYAWWPVFRCPSMPGFGCPPRLLVN